MPCLTGRLRDSEEAGSVGDVGHALVEGGKDLEQLGSDVSDDGGDVIDAIF